MSGSSTLYLIRHAQAVRVRSAPSAEWPLSAVGIRQAQALAPLLRPLEITQVYSSPFVRSVATAAPFCALAELEPLLIEDLRERILDGDFVAADVRRRSSASQDSPRTVECNDHDLWCRSWDDFAYPICGGESSVGAQRRFCHAISTLVAGEHRTAAVFTHGHVIALFLNFLDPTIGRKDAERLTNPDVLRIEWNGAAFTWDRAFQLPGLKGIATRHTDTSEAQLPARQPTAARP